jgi:replicative DNA helicase
MADVAREIESIPLYIDETSGLTFAQLAARARRLKRQRGLDLIIVDNIQLLHNAMLDDSNERDHDTPDYGAQFKGLAKEINIPIIVLTELRQPPGENQSARPELNRLREGSITEREADVVLFLFREEYHLANARPGLGTDAHARWITEMDAAKGIAEIIIAKHRRGATGTTYLYYRPELASFSKLEQTAESTASS